MYGYEAHFLPPVQGEEEGLSEYTGYSDHFGGLLHQVAEHITGRKGPDAILTRDETDQLMLKIIAGEDASQQISTEGSSEALEQCVKSGLIARQHLLEGTARLGRRLGINSMGPQFDNRWRPTGFVPNMSGGLSRIANLTSQYADVDDRIQSALSGMPTALRRYAKSFREALAAEDPELAVAALPGFATIVMFASREAIYADMSSHIIREPMGARIKYGDLLRVRDARKKYRSLDLNLVTRDQVATKEEYQELQEVRDIIEASYHVPWDDIIFPDAAPEERLPYELDEHGEEIPFSPLYDFESEPPIPLYLEEVYPDPRWREGFSAVETALTWMDPKRGFLYDTSYLTERERREFRQQQISLILYCGFPLEGYLPDAHSFPEIAKLIGVKTPQSIYRSKRNAINKLQRSGSAMALLQNLTWVNGDEGTVAQAFTGDRIRTGHRVLKSASQPPAATADLTPSWARRVQDLPLEAETPQRGTPAYEKISRSLTRGILSALEELSVPAKETKRTPYPKNVYDQIETHVGKHLSVRHIEDFWNHRAGALLELRREGGMPVNANRLGQLVSKLLANRLQPDDKVTLNIPDVADGQCGYLGAWISQGEVKIIGNPGNYIGFGMSGSGVIRVMGSVGYYAGAYGSGRSLLDIRGDAGRQAGYKLRDQSSVHIQENAKMPVATDIRDASFVQVGEFSWGSPEASNAPAVRAEHMQFEDERPEPIILGPTRPASSPLPSPPLPPPPLPRPPVLVKPVKPRVETVRPVSDTPPPLWTHHVQDLKVERGQRLQPKTRSYKLVAEAFKEAVISSIDQLTTPDDVNSPYPEQLYNDVAQHLGAYLTSQHIEAFWNREVPRLIGERRWNRKLQLNPNRLGQLISKLLAYCLEEEDHVKLVIPEGVEGQCGYLGAWATRGVITIVGEAGDYTGAFSGGTALVAVEGDVGDYAGEQAHGESYLVVDGQAGNFLGHKAYEASTIAVQEAAGESVAVDIAGQASVVVGDIEWSPSRGIKPHQIRPDGADEDEEELEEERLEVAPVSEDPGDTIEPDPEEKPQEVREPEKADEEPVEIAEDTPPSPSPSPSRQSSQQTIDFEDAAYYLGVESASALQRYTDQIGHTGQEPLTAAELVELRHRFPELS